MLPDAGIRRASIMRTAVADRRRSSIAPQGLAHGPRCLLQSRKAIPR